MSWMAKNWVAGALLSCLAGCDGCDKAHVATPASTSETVETKTLTAVDLPQGVDPAASATAVTHEPAAEPHAVAEPAPVEPAKPAEPASALSASKVAAKETSVPTAPKATTPTTLPKTTTVAATPAKSVLPQTKHVRFEVDAKMQTLLDGDPRMAKWAARILPVIEACYLGQLMHPSAVIKVGVTLHANKGPDTAIKTLPATLAAMVPCATTKLMNARPPMLTGTEGETHTVGIRFTP